MIKEVLRNYENEDTAFVVNDYPYGFRLRTKIRYWVETKKGYGQRFCSQTLNPKTDKWNKPKKGTYNVIIGMYKDENDHITYETLSSGGWSKEEQIQEFEKVFSPFTEHQTKAIRYIRATNKANEVIKVTIKPSEEGKKSQTMEEQAEIYNKAIRWGYTQI